MSNEFNLEQAQADLLALWNSHNATIKADKAVVSYRMIGEYTFTYSLTLHYLDGQHLNIKIDSLDEMLSHSEQYHRAALILKQNFAEFGAMRREIEVNK